MLNRPLPNDLLVPPWHETMPTWAIDEALRANIPEAEAELRAQDYEVRYGVEINLGLRTPNEAQALKRPGRSTLYEWRHACREQFERDLQAAGSYSAAATETYDMLAQLAETHIRQPTPESAGWLDNWRLTQAFYEQALSAEGDTALAKKNFMIASLHLLPPLQGGVRGLIENRFASAHYGYGWWDHEQLELRTTPVEGVENAIRRAHEVLWRLKYATEHFGLVPVVDEAMVQVHFSLWRIKDNQNIMALEDDESLALRMKIARMMYDCFNQLPVHQVSGATIVPAVRRTSFASSSRVNTIRTCDDNWELRLPHLGGVTHLARDAAFIFGAIYSVLRPDEALPHDSPEEKAKTDWISRSTLDALMGHSAWPEREARIIRRMAINTDRLRPACPLISCLEAAILGEQDELVVDKGTLTWNLDTLIKRIGRSNLDFFSAQVGGKIHNLSTVAGWHELFKKIRIIDGRFDLSGLHPALAAHFDGLTISHIRRDIHIPAAEAGETAALGHYQDVFSAYMLSHHEKMDPPDREVYAFIHKRCMFFDPEDATRYLASLYLLPFKDAVYKFMNDALGHNLLNAIRHRVNRLDKPYPCFEDHDLLCCLLSYREGVLPAFAEIARHDLPRSEKFFGNLEKLVGDLVRLCAPAQIRPNLVWTTRHMPYMPDLELILAYTKQDKNPYTLFKEDSIDKDLDLFREILLQRGRPAGASLVRIAAAAQTGTEGRAAILRQYAAEARQLTHGIRPRNPPRPSRTAFQREFLRGVEAGASEEAARLLTDPSPLPALRQRALEILHA